MKAEETQKLWQQAKELFGEEWLGKQGLDPNREAASFSTDEWKVLIEKSSRDFMVSWMGWGDKG